MKNTNAIEFHDYIPSGGLDIIYQIKKMALELIESPTFHITKLPGKNIKMIQLWTGEYEGFQTILYMSSSTPNKEGGKSINVDELTSEWMIYLDYVKQRETWTGFSQRDSISTESIHSFVIAPKGTTAEQLLSYWKAQDIGYATFITDISTEEFRHAWNDMNMK